MKNGKDNMYVTKVMLGEAVDAILEGMNKMIGDLQNNIDTRFDNLEVKVDSNDNALKNEIDGLNAEFSDIPSRRELKELEAKIGKSRYPLS